MDGGGHRIVPSVRSVVVIVVCSFFYTCDERGEPRVAVVFLYPGIEVTHVETEPFGCLHPLRSRRDPGQGDQPA